MWVSGSYFFITKGPLNTPPFGGFSDPVLNKLFYQGERVANPAPYWKKMVLRATQQATGCRF